MLDKHKLQQQKSRDIADRINSSVEDHRALNYDRFYQRDIGLKRVEENRQEFLKSEAQRHNTKIKAREQLLSSIHTENQQKKEMNRLRMIDSVSNVERERKRKQESQDFYLKKQFLKNAFNQEASVTAQSMI